jgi:Uncharacterized protein conserved in bacteria (DUF2252)
MASDLAGTSRSEIRVQLCGDAHLSNFGGCASPERGLLFDINQFDETLPGPWDWDIERLAASIEVAGRQSGYDSALRRRIVSSVGEYRHAMHGFAGMKTLDVWYARLDESELFDRFAATAKPRHLKRCGENIGKAKRKASTPTFARLAHDVERQCAHRFGPALHRSDRGPASGSCS